MKEPDSGYILAGPEGEQLCYRRDNYTGRILFNDFPEEYPHDRYRWVHVGDPNDVYTWEDLIADYGKNPFFHLNPCQLCGMEGDG